MLCTVLQSTILGEKLEMLTRVSYIPPKTDKNKNKNDNKNCKTNV